MRGIQMENGFERSNVVADSCENATGTEVNRESPLPRHGSRGSWIGWLLKSLTGVAIILGLLTAVVIWYFGSLAPAVAYIKGDRLLIHPTEISFGEAYPGEKRTLHFRLWNFTGGPVRLLGTNSTCSCLTTESFPLVITEGERRTLEVVVSAPYRAANVDVSTIYFTDWSGKPSFSFRTQGRIVEAK